MPNGATHKTASALAIGLTAAVDEHRRTGHVSRETLVATVSAWTTGSLPDILEPATHPNHRQFFHSVAFAGLVAYGTWEAYQWNPQDELERVLRIALLAVGGGYLIHLLLDASTPKGLPLIGRI